MAAPVKLRSASVDDLRALRKNPTGKMLMVNFGLPGVRRARSSYPQLLETYLWYRSRDFEFVSVSVDAPTERAKVEKFLIKTHSAVRNLQVNTDDVYAVMKAFDPSRESAFPSR